MASLALAVANADAADGWWRSVSTPLPDLDRAEAAAMEGDSLGAAFFFDLVMARVQAALSRAAEVSASPADGTEDCRLLAIARWIAAEQGGRPEPSSAYELEFRCPVREGWPVTVWLTLLRRDQMAGGMRGYAPGPRRLFP